MELPQSCTKPSICTFVKYIFMAPCNKDVTPMYPKWSSVSVTAIWYTLYKNRNQWGSRYFSSFLSWILIILLVRAAVLSLSTSFVVTIIMLVDDSQGEKTVRNSVVCPKCSDDNFIHYIDLEIRVLSMSHSMGLAMYLVTNTISSTVFYVFIFNWNMDFQ